MHWPARSRQFEVQAGMALTKQETRKATASIFSQEISSILSGEIFPRKARLNVLWSPDALNLNFQIVFEIYRKYKKRCSGETNSLDLIFQLGKRNPC